MTGSNDRRTVPEGPESSPTLPMSESQSSPSAARLAVARLPALVFAAPFWFAAYAAWFALLFLLSSLPGGGGPDFPTHTDKVAHFLYFAGGGFALATALRLRSSKFPAAAVVALVLVAGALVGAFDEWHQTFTESRAGLDLGDWIADLLGTLAGIFAAFAALRWLRAHDANRPPSS